jgi:hypothetical protein
MRVFWNKQSLQISPDQATTLTAQLEQQGYPKNWTTLIGYLRDYGLGHIFIFELGVTEEQFVALEAALLTK